MHRYHPAVIAISLFVTASAEAQHVDVRPYVSNNQLVTGSAELQGATVIPLSDHHRVFGAEFGEDDPNQPFFTEDPGLLSEPGALPGGSGKMLGFNVLAGLQYWTGSGFGSVPSGESLYISLGSQETLVSNVPVSGFSFAIEADEGLHHHLSFELLGSDGNPIPGDGIEPATGVYLLELEFKTTITGVANSDPLWFVFNNHDSEENHDAAIDWVAENYVPEPASGLILLAGGVMAFVRRGSARTV